MVEPMGHSSGGGDADLDAIAGRLVSATRSCQALGRFPGELPRDLVTAYRIQDLAIERWGERIGGWKVGRIPLELEADAGIDRLAGPIFGSAVRTVAAPDEIEMPVFDGGFAAIEAEFVAVIGQDAFPGKRTWSREEAAAIIADLCIGIEIASSPLPTINDLGPNVIVSDFGNNAGLLVGPPIRNWRTRPLESMRCETYVDGENVGVGGAFRLTGGFLRSVQFMLEHGAARGRPLAAGQVIATGQTTGIHVVAAGQEGRVSFGEDGELRCRLRKAQA